MRLFLIVLEPPGLNYRLCAVQVNPIGTMAGTAFFRKSIVRF